MDKIDAPCQACDGYGREVKRPEEGQHMTHGVTLRWLTLLGYHIVIAMMGHHNCHSQGYFRVFEQSIITGREPARLLLLPALEARQATILVIVRLVSCRKDQKSQRLKKNRIAAFECH